MTHLLQIDSRPRGERSHSRRLTREFVEHWQHAHPNATVTYRDIGCNTVPHSVENDEYGATSLAQSIANARAQIAQLVGG